MTTATYSRWTRFIAPLAALWYAFGLSQAIRAYISTPDAAPLLIWLAYAAACTFGLIGSAALAFAPNRAATAFGISLFSAAAYYLWLFTQGTPAGKDYGIAAMVILITSVLLLVSRRFR